MNKLVLLIILIINVALYAKVTETKLGDGTKVILDTQKSEKTVIKPDGTQEVINLKGKTPFGITIDKIDRPLQQKPVAVNLIFDPLLSDELCDGNVKLLFDELYDSLKAKVSSKKYQGKSALTVSVSFCRYGEYGYCDNKMGEVTILLLESGKVKKSFKINMSKLKEKKNRFNFITMITKAL